MDLGTKKAKKKENVETDQNAEAKFDALFGEPEPPQQKENNTDLEDLIKS